MSSVVAPGRVQTNVAPTVFEDPDISFDDLDERLWVSTQSKRTVVWEGFKREWVFKPGAKPIDVPLGIVIKYLGDPRSMHGVTNQFNDKTTGKVGVVPERYAELRRLSVLYGVYEGNIARMHTIKFKDLPRDIHPGGGRDDRDLFPHILDKNETVVPKMTVMTIHDHPVKFPIYEPDASPYRYDTAVGGNSDMVAEMEKIKRQYADLAARIEAGEARLDHDDADIPPASEDSVGPPVF